MKKFMFAVLFFLIPFAAIAEEYVDTSAVVEINIGLGDDAHDGFTVRLGRNDAETFLSVFDEEIVFGIGLHVSDGDLRDNNAVGMAGGLAMFMTRDEAGIYLRGEVEHDLDGGDLEEIGVIGSLTQYVVTSAPVIDDFTVLGIGYKYNHVANRDAGGYRNITFDVGGSGGTGGSGGNSYHGCSSGSQGNTSSGETCHHVD